ncbi:hypothetical protein MSIM_20320 [Mycobacterium simiae]|nr:hypothetical protein MSIM_20320 [Mycobacterium simiae]
MVSGEICPGDWANVNAREIAPTKNSQRRDRGVPDEPAGDSAAASGSGDPLRRARSLLRSPRPRWRSPLATVAVFDPVEH